MKSKKGIAANNATDTLELELPMNKYRLYQNKLQHNSSREWLESTKLSRLPERKAFVCDECARPLHLYGENFIETYTNGKANTLRCLCDLHAEELEVKA